MTAGGTIRNSSATALRAKSGSRPTERQIRLMKRYRLYPPKSSSPPSPDKDTVTLSRANLQIRYVGIWDESENGSSYIEGSNGTTFRASLAFRYTSVCSVPRREATLLACAASLYSSWWKPTVKVFTGRLVWACMTATTVVESIPPERKAPNGTSAIIRRRTADSSWWWSCLIASASSTRSGDSSPFEATALAHQNRCNWCEASSDSSVRIVPGCSLCSPS